MPHTRFECLFHALNLMQQKIHPLAFSEGCAGEGRWGQEDGREEEEPQEEPHRVPQDSKHSGRSTSCTVENIIGT